MMKPASPLEKVVLITVSLIIAEFALRWLGLPQRFDTTAPQLATRALLDAEVGWKNRPGSFFLINPAESEKKKVVSILPNGARDSGCAESCQNAKSKVVVVGDSFPFGMGLSDNETVAWQLAKSHPTQCIENQAVPGYGTYQSLLRIKQILRENPNTALTVIYGFNVFHELRNIGDPVWQRQVRWGQAELPVELPFCHLDSTGKLIENPASAQLPHIPFRSQLSLSVLIEELLARGMSWYQAVDSFAVTTQLLLEMQRTLSQSQSQAKLIIVFLAPEQQKYQQYADFMTAEGLDFIDCRHPHGDSVQFKLPGDPHPNALVHQYWSECLSAKIDFFARN